MEPLPFQICNRKHNEHVAINMVLSCTIHVDIDIDNDYF